MNADIDADEVHVTVPLETHVLPLRGGRIELVGERGSIPVDMTRRHIGRSPRCELVLNDSTVSSVHAEVQATPRGVGLSISTRATARSSMKHRSSRCT
jgi:pSer/pThr/pTyr-binding forkhead associated (FHA) protein